MRIRAGTLILLALLTAPVGGAAMVLDHVSTQAGPSWDSIQDILRDDSGFLWLATADGLVRYDGYEFRRWRHDPQDPASLPGNHLWSISLDRTGDLWVGSSGSGLARFRGAGMDFVRYEPDGAAGSFDGYAEVPSVVEGSSGDLWIAAWERGLNHYDPRTGRFDQGLGERIRGLGDAGSAHRVFEDRRGDLWIGTNRGIVRYEPSADRLTVYKAGENEHQLSGEYIYGIEEIAGELWFATNAGGVCRLDQGRESFTRYRHDPEDASSLRSDCVLSLAADAEGRLWIGTEDGLDLLDPGTGQIEHVEAADQRSLTVTAVEVDAQGIVWVGTAGNGLYRHHPQQRRFEHFRTQLTEPVVDAVLEMTNGSIWTGGAYGNLDQIRPDGSIVPRAELTGGHGVAALAESPDGDLYVALDGGGIVQVRDGTHRLRSWTRDPDDPGSLPANSVTCMAFDSAGALWFGTDGAGVGRIDPVSGRSTNFSVGDAPPLPDILHVFAVHTTGDGRVWFGSWGGGARVFDPHNGHTRIWLPEEEGSTTGDIVVAIAEDADGRMWLGTWGDGLVVVDPHSGAIERFSAADGLPNDIVLGLVPDHEGRMWVSTNRGLASFDPATGAWRTFDVTDGLQSMQFRRGAAHGGPSGRIYFGGPNGLNAFLPDRVEREPGPVPVVFTSIEASGREILPARFAGDEPVRLTHRENHLSVQFAALDFTNSARNLYQYRLDGVDGAWVDAGHRRFASYAHLGPGTYVLRVRASNGDGEWSAPGVALTFAIAAPLWRTPLAYALYFLAATAVLLWWRRLEMRRLRLASELRIERMEAAKLRDLDEAKSKFFANISHEFRTPITLILGPLERLHRSLGGDAPDQIGVIRRSALRLLGLIDQVLDLAKLESSQVRLEPRNVDLRDCCRATAANFDALVAGRGVALVTEFPEHAVPVRLDVDRFEKCIANLLANAIRFTPMGGRVVLRVILERSGQGQNRAVLEVEDDGAGIRADEIGKIFDRFYQGSRETVDGSSGTGVGLALTREIVSLHGGTIEVESPEGQGACFRIRLDAFADDVRAELAVEQTAVPEQLPKGRPVVLVVDDNADMCDHIRRELSDTCEVIEAHRGDTGLSSCIDHGPELLITDVMMPGLDGFELCRAVKADPRTSHTPVILLTARSGEEERYTGLELGADDYLTKPFSSRELRARTMNLIESRRRLRERFRNSSIAPIELAMNPTDAIFLEHLLKVVEENVEDPDFNVEAFAGEVGMSRMHLHRKVKALTGQTCGEFLRTIRLRAAAEQLRTGRYTVAEVAYAAGFRAPTHFATAFKGHFGKTPSEYMSGSD